jgi:hypothetical protein
LLYPFSIGLIIIIIITYIIPDSVYELYFGDFSSLLISSIFENFRQILLAISISLLVAIYIIPIAYEKTEKITYEKALESLINEMSKNYLNLENFSSNLENVKDKWKDDKIGWSPKNPSFTCWNNSNIGNFYLKYCPSSAYYVFINEGYIQKNNTINKTALAHFYDFCGRFSTELQQNENSINQYIVDKLNNTPNKEMRNPNLGLSTDCSSNFTLENLNSKNTSDVKKIKINDQKKSIDSPKIQMICNGVAYQYQSVNDSFNFLNEMFLKFYTNKNPLNEGIFKEYSKFIDSIQNNY